MENNQANPTPAQPSQAMEVLPKSSDYDMHVSNAEAKSLDFMNPKRWQTMQVMAQAFMQSGALPDSIKNAPQLIMVFQAGYEAGLQPIEALNSFYFVNGKLSMYGNIAIAQVKKAGHKVIWGECNDKTATVKIIRKDTNEEMSSTFTMEQAKARKLTEGKYGPKDVWTKFPENMLKFKAFWMTAPFIVPDALHGMQVKEVLEAEIEPEATTESKTKPVADAKVVEPIVHKTLEDSLKEKEDADKAKAEETAKAKDVEPKTKGGKKMKEAMDKTKEKLNEKK